ncbi:rubrerythrin-like domain-containing protein [Haloferax sp. DFSO60]|uniref:rubrerythrin-like domain-containing protein n=1 Tax=Haloferax sp. DFSO60 TaxID=3388652 RepID=UPI00397ABF8D
MTADTKKRESTELVEAETRELVERPTEALVERAWYECVSCGYRSGHGVHERLCPRCGGTLKNIGVAQE